PGVKFCAGEGGLRSWEWCGGGGVECRVGKGGEWGWREKLLKGMNNTCLKNVRTKYCVDFGVLTSLVPGLTED
nr:hypothetical protein [Tanacetum cinerariifolium]